MEMFILDVSLNSLIVQSWTCIDAVVVQYPAITILIKLKHTNRSPGIIQNILLQFISLFTVLVSRDARRHCNLFQAITSLTCHSLLSKDKNRKCSADHVWLPALSVDRAVDTPPEIVLRLSLPGEHRDT